MIRTQIQLNEDQARRIKEAARIEGISAAEMIRRCVDRALPELRGRRAERYARAMRVIGGFSAGRDNMAEEHDAYLDGAFE
ncbi:MAG: ribbon-helix-helix protein, CopG family [Deltaproteobacteria bacterium]|nr:ribbon-helix-helix protein, CopG family [Deltaproteobacteria bacterium]